MCPDRVISMQYFIMWEETKVQRAVGHVRAVVGRILFIGVSVQILLGLLWMFLAFDDRQEFFGSAYAEWLDRNLAGVHYEPAIYLLQLCVAFFAGYWLLEGLGARKKFWKIWGSFAILTYPYAMQCHMAILPDSLAFSCFLLLLAAGLKRRKIIYFFWLISAMFLPEYLYFGAVPVMVFLFLSARKKGNLRELGMEIMIIMSVAVIGLGFRTISSVEGEGLEEAWFRRTVWSSFYQFYPDWPTEVRAAITADEYVAIERLPENMELILRPKVKAILGEKGAGQWYREFSAFVFRANREQILKEMIKDAGGCLSPQIMAEIRLGGKGGPSYCLRNYEIMREDHPLLTSCFLGYSAWWHVVGMLGVFIMVVGRLCSNRTNRVKATVAEKECWRCVLTAGVLSATLMIGYYTLWASNLWDPKKALFVGILWSLWMIRETGLVIGFFSEKSGEVYQ